MESSLDVKSDQPSQTDDPSGTPTLAQEAPSQRFEKLSEYIYPCQS